MRHSSTYCANKGFTLVELMVTISIAAILLAMAVPSFQESIANNRLTTSSNVFAHSLDLARTEAIKRSVNVTLCPGLTGTTCATSSFQDGWVIFSDTGATGALDGTDEIISTHSALTGSITLVLTTGPSITFSSTGFAQASDTLTVCDGRTGETGKTITISRSGSSSVAKSLVPCS